MIEAIERAGEEHKAVEKQAFVERQPPNEVELAAIERAKKRTKARAPRVTLQIDERGTSSPHSDVEGNRYRLADAFPATLLSQANEVVE